MDECCAPPHLNLGGPNKQDDAYRRTLWMVLAINAAMFAVEVIAVSFGLRWEYRAGEPNMRAEWICPRTDVLGNLAVLLAAPGVFGPGPGWPDVIVAAIMAALAIQGAALVIRQGSAELRAG